MDLEEYKKRMDAIRKTYVDTIQKIDDELTEKTRRYWIEEDRLREERDKHPQGSEEWNKAVRASQALEDEWQKLNARSTEARKAALDAEDLAIDKFANELLRMDQKGFVA